MKYSRGVILACVFMTISLLFGIIVWNFMFIRIRERSMEPTFQDGEVLLIRKIHRPDQYHLEYGDIVVYTSPEEDKWVIKRVILTGKGPVTVENGWLIAGGRRYFLNKEQRRRLLNDKNKREGLFFAVGDNQFHSIDSREYGYVPYENLIGIVPGRRRIEPVYDH